MLNRLLYALVPWGNRRGYLLPFVAAIVLASSSLPLGYLLDDLFLMKNIEGGLQKTSPFDVYRFADGNPAFQEKVLTAGYFPWFALPELKLRCFRPLSSALMTLDHALFGEAAVWAHVHSILWYALLLWGLMLILRRSLPRPLALLTLFLFAINYAHWLPVAWWCHRNTLVAAAPMLFGLAAHLRWREEGWRPGLPLSVLGYALGVLGGEMALCVFGYLAAYEACRAPGPWRQRLLALLPGAFVGLCYTAAYKALDFGAYGSGAYIEPLGQPLAYLSAAPGRVIALLSGAIVMIPSELWDVLPAARPIVLFGGLAGCALLAWLLRRAWPALDEKTRKTVLWLLAGGALSLLPISATFPMSRLMMLPSIGLCTAFAVVLHHWWHERTQPGPIARPSRFAALAAGFLIAINVVYSALFWPVASAGLYGAMRVAAESALEAEIDDTRLENQAAVLLTAPDPMVGFYTSILRFRTGLHPLPRNWWVLSYAPYDHRLRRTAPNRFELQVVDGAYLSMLFEKLVRGPEFPFHPGDQVAFSHLTATILDVNEVGPTRVEFAFDPPIDTPEYQFLYWHDGRIRPFPLPPVGEEVYIPMGQSPFHPAALYRRFFRS